MNLEAYFLVLLSTVAGAGLGLAPTTIGRVLGPNNLDPDKLSPYECGFEVPEDACMKFDVRYYLIAIPFILFDPEAVFLSPWGVVLREIGWLGFFATGVSPLEFLVGFVYIWKEGAFDRE